jgi:hypothetical protein
MSKVSKCSGRAGIPGALAKARASYTCFFKILLRCLTFHLSSAIQCRALIFDPGYLNEARDWLRWS